MTLVWLSLASAFGNALVYLRTGSSTCFYASIGAVILAIILYAIAT